MLIDGVHVPLTAPFYRDGRSYLRKLEHNVGRYSLGPVAGLVLAAPGGERSGLSDAEVAEAMRAVSDSAAPEKVLVAGVSRPSVFNTLELAEVATAANFDALLLAPPVGLGQREATVYLQTIADAAALPVLLEATGMDVTWVAELASHPNILGMYDAGLDVERYHAILDSTGSVQHEVTVTTIFAPVTRRMKTPVAIGAATFVSAESLSGGTALAVAPPVEGIKTRTKYVGFQIMASGSVRGLVELLQAGVAGAMPELAACVPQAVHEVYAAHKDGDPALSREKLERILSADDLLLSLGDAGIKYAADLSGYFGGQPRLPRLPLSADQLSSVDLALAGLRS